MEKEQICKRCGTRASAFGSYETCTAGGPPHEWADLEVVVSRLMVLDPKKAHERNPNCPSRLVQNPQGQWYCVDCGFHVMWKRVKVLLVDDEDQG